jgi:hypothetical protein
MMPTEITFFSVTLFLSLAALLNWKHRRDAMQARLSKGLRGYVNHGNERPVGENQAGEALIPA